MNIVSITTEYDHIEDRVRLRVSAADRQPHVLWLTRRLSERLVGALIQGLLNKPSTNALVADDYHPPEAPQGATTAALSKSETSRPTDGQATNPNVKKGSSNPIEEHTAQVYAQLEARLAKKGAAPVPLHSAVPTFLVEEIQVKLANNGVRVLVMKCKNDTYEMVLTPVELRQWLEVLRVGFRKGDWRTDIFPTWMPGLV